MRKVPVTELIITLSYPSSSDILYLGSNICFYTSCSTTSSTFFSKNKDHISHPYKTINKFTVLYILISMVHSVNWKIKIPILLLPEHFSSVTTTTSSFSAVSTVSRTCSECRKLNPFQLLSGQYTDTAGNPSWCLFSQVFQLPSDSKHTEWCSVLMTWAAVSKRETVAPMTPFSWPVGSYSRHANKHHLRK
jgi:hypothetical protein